MKINRLKRLIYKYRKFDIIVDGEKQGTINNDETLEHKLPEGEHSVQFKYYFERSKPIIVHNSDELDIHVRDDVLKIMLIVALSLITFVTIFEILFNLLFRTGWVFVIPPILAVGMWTIIYLIKIAPNTITVKKK